LVDRERARLWRMHVIVGVALAVAATALLLAGGASALGGARWMALPRPLPFVVWLIVLAADACVLAWTGRRLRTRATRAWVAPAYNDGLLAILRPVRAWNGTLLPRIAFVDLPPAVLRGETMRLGILAPRRTSLTLWQRIPGEAWKSEQVAVGRNGAARVD